MALGPPRLQDHHQEVILIIFLVIKVIKPLPAPSRLLPVSLGANRPLLPLLLHRVYLELLAQVPQTSSVEMRISPLSRHLDPFSTRTNLQPAPRHQNQVPFLKALKQHRHSSPRPLTRAYSVSRHRVLVRKGRKQHPISLYLILVGRHPLLPPLQITHQLSLLEVKHPQHHNQALHKLPRQALGLLPVCSILKALRAPQQPRLPHP